MVLGRQKRKFTNWVGWRFRIGVVGLEECIDVLACVIRGIEDISVRCVSFDKVIRSSILNIMLYVFHLEAYRLRV